MVRQEYNPTAGIDFNSYFAPPKEGNTTTFTPHQQPEPEPKPEYDPNAVIDTIFSDIPKPVKNQASQDRIKRIQKVNALGEGLSALGDIFSLSQGANVKRRQYDGKNERLQALFEQREDDYDRRMDDYNRQVFNNKIQGMIYKTQRDDRAQDIQMKQDEIKRMQSNTDRQFAAMDEDRKERRDMQKENIDLRKDEIKRQADQFNRSHALSKESLDWQKEKSNIDFQRQIAMQAMKVQVEDDKNAFRLYDDKGKEIARVDTKGGIDKLLSVILSDTSAATEIDALKAQFGEGLSPQIKQYLVGKYWDKSPNAVKWIEGNKGAEASQSSNNQWDQYELQ